MAVGDAHVFPGFLTPVLTQLFSPKPPTTFLTCLCRGKRRKYAGKKVRLNRVSNSQPPDHESDTLITDPPGRGVKRLIVSLCSNCNHPNTVFNLPKTHGNIVTKRESALNEQFNQFKQS